MKCQQVASQLDLGSALLSGPKDLIDETDYFHMDSTNFTSADNNGAKYQELAGTDLYFFELRTFTYVIPSLS